MGSEDFSSLLADLNSIADVYKYGDETIPRSARAVLLQKLRQLTQSLIAPEMMAQYHGLNMAELVSIRTFIKLKVLEKIPVDKSITLEDLAKATGVQESLLERMARPLVATNFLTQEYSNGGPYKHTPRSIAYTDSSSAAQPLFLVLYDEGLKRMYNFDEYIVARNQYPNAREPDDPTYNPFTWTSGQDGSTIWPIIAEDPERLKTLQVGLADINAAVPPIGHFDFDVLTNSTDDGDRVQLVDVGGASGRVLAEILGKHPLLNPELCVLQDLAEPIDIAKQNIATGFLPYGLRVMESDFWGPQSVKGAKAYFMRLIMHDYSDANCILILSHLAEAMLPDSRVLICESIIPDRLDDSTFFASVLDMCVMGMGGKERSETGFAKILDGAGLEVVKAWTIPGIPGGCVEGRLKRK